MNVLEGACLFVNKLPAELLPLYLFICLVILHFIVYLLTPLSLFYSVVVAIFLFIRWSCTQGHYFFRNNIVVLVLKNTDSKENISFFIASTSLLFEAFAEVVRDIIKSSGIVTSDYHVI